MYSRAANADAVNLNESMMYSWIANFEGPLATELKTVARRGYPGCSRCVRVGGTCAYSSPPTGDNKSTGTIAAGIARC